MGVSGGAVVVVELGEGVDLVLQVGDGGGGWLGREFFWRTWRRASSVSKPLRLVRPPWAKRVVNTRPLSVKVE